MTTLDACELTRPPAGDGLKDRGASVAAFPRGVGAAIGGSLASRLGRRDLDRLAARFSRNDACAPITEVHAVDRCRDT